MDLRRRGSNVGLRGCPGEHALSTYVNGTRRDFRDMRRAYISYISKVTNCVWLMMFFLLRGTFFSGVFLGFRVVCSALL